MKKEPGVELAARKAEIKTIRANVEELKVFIPWSANTPL